MVRLVSLLFLLFSPLFSLFLQYVPTSVMIQGSRLYPMHWTCGATDALSNSMILFPSVAA